MAEILLVDATEQIETLARELEAAGFTVAGRALDEVEEHLASAAPDALVISLLDAQDARAARRLLASKTLPARTATLAIVRPDQLSEVDADLPVDDFAVFPGITEELIARLRRAIAERSGGESGHMLQSGDLTIDQANYKVYLSGRPVELTFKEYELLRFLAVNPNKVYTRETLLNRVWGYDFYGGARTVDVHIRRLRSKIEDHTHSVIETVRNVGYRLHAD